jgi:UDP-2-acetamido-3-amino-2,3-dideoxy-glucuronate N-acetyltransferase
MDGDNHALSSLLPSDLGPNLLIGAEVVLADDVEIGANVVVHDGVSVEAGVLLEHGVVLGRVARRTRGTHTAAAQPGPTVVGAEAVVCPYAVVEAGVRIGPGALVGDHTSIRGRATIGAGATVGAFCVISGEVEVGERVRMQSHCGIGPGVVIEADAFLGPAVRILTGRTMGDRARATPILRRGCQVGTGARILQGVEIGEEAVVGAGAVVTANVPAGVTVRGVPASAA